MILIFSVPKPRASLLTPAVKLHKPKYRNTTLEKLITENKDKAKLNLLNGDWTDEDMEIVAYYAIQDNKVSDFCLCLSGDETKFLCEYMFL